MSFDSRPTAKATSTDSPALNLHELAVAGKPAEERMRSEVEQLNQQYAGNKEVLKKIADQYKFMNKDHALFANEVKLGLDGSLTFAPNTVTSKVLRDIEKTVAREYREIHKIDKQVNAYNSTEDSDRMYAAEKRRVEITHDLVRQLGEMRREEHLLAPAPMKPHGEVSKGYSDSQRQAMQDLVDKSVSARPEFDCSKKSLVADEDVNLSKNVSRLEFFPSCNSDSDNRDRPRISQQTTRILPENDSLQGLY